MRTQAICQKRRPAIAIAGIACENSTFSPARTSASAFKIKRGQEVLDGTPFLHSGSVLREAADWYGALVGYALPGGMVTRSAFEELASELITRLELILASLDEALDGVWFDIHGAMSVEGLDDVEYELLRRIRIIVGPRTTVSASMDLHGNVSRQLVHQVDLITCYRTAPHIDVRETKERACRNLIDVLRNPSSGSRPLKAWIPIPILLPGEQTSTRLEPAKSIYAAINDVEDDNAILDAAVWVGYCWADEPRNRAIVTVTGWNEYAVSTGAERLARLFWQSRKDFDFVAPTGTFDECFDAAMGSTVQPYFISDSGDNPTAGGSGDATWTLGRLLKRLESVPDSPEVTIYASIPGPEAVRIAYEAGIGATITVTAGAAVDNVHAGPITMTGKVHAIKRGDPWAEMEVVLHTCNTFVIITKFRKPYHLERDFIDLNLNPRSANMVIVKIGYLEPELYDMAADWMLALTPGGVDQDLKRLGHRRVIRPVWPLDTTFDSEPDLAARIIPMSDQQLPPQQNLRRLLYDQGVVARCPLFNVDADCYLCS